MWLAAALLTASGTGIATCAERDASALIHALVEAELRTDLDAAMALFADGAVVINATGWKIAKREDLRWFINTEIWLRDSFDLDQVETHGNRVTWMEPGTGTFYQTIGVAPVRYAFEAEVDNGRITSIVSHIPAQEIRRIAAACKATKVARPEIHDRSCAEFLKLVEAHTNGIYAHLKLRADDHPKPD